jgi:hypothetical protein
MYEERNESPLISEILRYFGTIFTLSILVISIAVSQVSKYFPDMKDIYSLFSSDGIGLSFGTILQIAIFSIVLAIFSVLLISDRLITKMRFLYRMYLFLLATLLTFSIFAIVFTWFPVNDIGAWIGLVLSTIICFSISIGLTLLKFKLERKKYDKLLANYKARNIVKQ